MKRLTLFVLLLLAAAPLFQVSAQERPWMKYITPSGYYQAGYSITDAMDNTFYIKRARIALAGQLFEDRYGKFEYCIWHVLLVVVRYNRFKLI